MTGHKRYTGTWSNLKVRIPHHALTPSSAPANANAGLFRHAIARSAASRKTLSFTSECTRWTRVSKRVPQSTRSSRSGTSKCTVLLPACRSAAVDLPLTRAVLDCGQVGCVVGRAASGAVAAGGACCRAGRRLCLVLRRAGCGRSKAEAQYAALAENAFCTCAILATTVRPLHRVCTRVTVGWDSAAAV